MEEILNQFYSNSTTPIWSAILLGLMTAISPCPLATNITAMGYISKDIENRNKVFYNGLFYTLGKAFSYTALAFILYLGADQFRIASIFQQYGERFLGPFMILIGLFMLGIFSFKFLDFNFLTNRFRTKKNLGFWDIFLLGFIFALAFCPYSGVLYFGMLIPLTIDSPAGLSLPIVFAIATSIPVILFAYLLAFTVSGVGKWYNSIKSVEKWFRKIIAVVFILIGLYYSYIIYF